MRLMDVEYGFIKDDLPWGFYKGKKQPDNRLFLDAVIYIARTGCG
jgi:hypothetical protein